MKRRSSSFVTLGMLGFFAVNGCNVDEVKDSAALVPVVNSAEPDEQNDMPGTPPVVADVELVFPWADDSPMNDFFQSLEPLRDEGISVELHSQLKGTPTPKNVQLAAPTWIRQSGYVGMDSAVDVTTDSTNGVYAVAFALVSTNPMRAQAVVRKYSASGSVLWTRFLGPISNTTIGMSIAYSSHGGGSVYITGATNGVLPAGTLQPSPPNVHSGGMDTFIAKYNTSGTLLWTRQFGSAGEDVGRSIAVEQMRGHPSANGEIYVAGYTNAVLPGVAGSCGGNDAFLVKYSPTGQKSWTRQFGSTTTDAGIGVAVDQDTNIYVTAEVQNTFTCINGWHSSWGVTHAGARDVLLTKWNGLGTKLTQQQVGTAVDDYPTGIDVSRKNSGQFDVYLSGYTLGTFPGTIPPNPGNAGAPGYDMFAMKYRGSGSVLNQQFVKQLPNDGDEKSFAIATDGMSNYYATIDVAGGSIVAKYDPSGNIVNGRVLSSTGVNSLRGITADYDNGVYAVGMTTGVFDYGTPNTTTVHAPESPMTNDSFITKLTIGCTINGSNAACNAGWNWGDPHLRTLDGLLYEFQAVGEFILAESTSGAPFVLQARQQAADPSGKTSLMSAIATNLGTDRVTLSNDNGPVLRVNGTIMPMEPEDFVRTAGDGTILRREDGSFLMHWPSGEDALFHVNASDGSIAVAFLAPVTRMNQLRGLLGNFDGDDTNDFALRSGTPLGSSLTFEQMYRNPGNYADAWRISQAESLFDYAPGQTTTTFTDFAAPSGPSSLSLINAGDRAAAEAVCTDVGVTDPVLQSQCTFDVAMTGNADTAQNAMRIQEFVTWQEMPPLEQSTVTVYSNDMQSSIGAEWSSNSMCVSPLGNRQMLGEFGNELVSLSIPALPPHGNATVSFDLIVMNGWDGDGPMGPSTFGLVDAAEGTLLLTSFSNTMSSQSYPDAYPSNHPPMAGAAESNSLYYPFGDAVYHLEFAYPHTDNDLLLHFYAQGLSGLMGEAWAIDNVNIVVGPANP